MPAAVGTGAGGALGLTFGSVDGNYNLNVRLSAAEQTRLGQDHQLAARAHPRQPRCAHLAGHADSRTRRSARRACRPPFRPHCLQLQVTPHVTSDGSVSLKVNVTRNEPDFSRTGANGQPTILKREADTELLVADGHTAVIGGIYTRNTSRTVDQVPFFGDIPIIGLLFQRRRQARPAQRAADLPHAAHREPRAGADVLEVASFAAGARVALCACQPLPGPTRVQRGVVRALPGLADHNSSHMSERVFLSGPMGSGKSQVATALAELWSTQPVDLDKRIEQRAGASVAEIFERRGEAAFRALERELLDQVLAEGAKIVALGGGTVTHTETRRRLLQRGHAGDPARLARHAERARGLGAWASAAGGARRARRGSPACSSSARGPTPSATPRSTPTGAIWAAIAQEVDRVVSEAPIVVPMGERTYRVEVVARRAPRGAAARRGAAVKGSHVVW